MPAFARYIHIASQVRAEAPTTERKIRGLTTEEKLVILEEFKRSKLTTAEFCRRQGFTRQALGKWLKGKALGSHGRQNAHPKELKAKVLEMYKAKVPRAQIAEETGIKVGTIGDWAMAWRLEGAL